MSVLDLQGVARDVAIVIAWIVIAAIIFFGLYFMFGDLFEWLWRRR